MHTHKQILGVLLVYIIMLVVGTSPAEEKTELNAGIIEPIAKVVERPIGLVTLTSGLRVPAGETFHLGERQTGDFTVSARNDGKVTVTILATRGKRQEVVGKVEPGETVVRAFKSSDGVLVQNQANKKASLYVEVWGTKNLAMYYKPNSEEE